MRVEAATSSYLNFQARLLTNGGTIVPDGSYNVEFKLYNVSTGGSSLWSETYYDSNGGGAGNDNRVIVKSGYLSVHLGSQTAFPALNWDQDLWLTMNVGNTAQNGSCGAPFTTPYGSNPCAPDGEMSPRLKLTAVPYAFDSGQLDGIDSTGFVQLGPSAVQGVNSANNAIRINQTGAGNILQLQGGSLDVLTLDKTGILTLGTSNGASGNTGKIVLANSANNNTVTIQSGSTTTTYALTLPLTVGNANECIKNSGTAGILTFGSCGAGGSGTLQDAYNNDADGSDAIITLNATDGGILIRDHSTPLSTAFAVQDNAGTGNLLSVASTGVNLGVDTTIAAQKTIRLVGGTTAQRPGSPSEGQIYFDTDTKQLLIYGGAAWQNMSRSSTKVVAASNSQTPAGADYQVTSAEETAGNADSKIQSAIDALPAGGGTVYLMEGTYTIDTAISVPNNVTLAGTGASTIVKLKNGINANFNAIQNSDRDASAPYNNRIILRDFKLDGNKTNNTSGTQNGIDFLRVGQGGGATATPGARIINIWIENFRNRGLLMDSSDNNNVTGNTFQSNDEEGLLIVTGSNNTITGNIAQGNTYGIGIQGSHNTVTGNIAQGNTDGIIVLADYNSVSGNTVYGNSSTGIWILSSSYNTISSNKVHDNGGSSNNHGIYLSGADNNSVTDNNITDTSCGTGSTSCFAINIANSTSDNNYLADNRISDTDADAATTIQDDGTGTIYANQARGANSAQITTKLASGTDAFQIQNTAGNGLFTIDTTNSEIEIGKAGASGIDGKLVIYNAVNSNAITLTVGTTSASYNLVLPTSAGSASECLKNGATPGVLTFGSCGGGATTTLQQAYDNDADGSDTRIDLTGSDDSIIFSNPVSSGSDSEYVLTVEQLATGATKGALLVTNAGGSSSYSLRVNDDGTNSDTTPFVIEGTGKVGIGTAAPISKTDIISSTTSLLTLGSSNTSSWSKVGGDSTNSSWPNTTIREVQSFTTLNGKLYAGTGMLGGGNAEVWEYNGSTWVQVGGDALNSSWANTTYETVYALTIFNGKLYAGLGFSVGDAEVWEYNGSTWVQVGGDALNSSWADSVYGTVRSMTSYNGMLYAGLASSAAGTAEVWRYNGSTWSKVGGDAVNSSWADSAYEEVQSLTIFNNELYAGLGNINEQDGEVWKYNGSTWTQIGGDSLNSSWSSSYNTVYALTPYNGKLYAGLGWAAEDEVWEYNGSTWTQIGGDSLNSSWSSGYEAINSLAVSNGVLYAGMSNTSSDADVWAYNGNTWAENSPGPSHESVRALFSYNGRLYAGLGNDAGDSEVWELNTSSYTTVARNGTGLSIGDYLFMGSYGQIGVGTLQPEATLDIQGDLRVSESLLVAKNGMVSTLGYLGLGTATPTSQLHVVAQSALTNGQTQVRQTLTVANATASGVVRANKLDLTVANTTAGTTYGHDITVTDNTSSIANTNVGLKVTLAGTNNNQAQYGLDVSVNQGIAIKAVTTGISSGSTTCNGLTGSYAFAICADSNNAAALNARLTTATSSISYTSSAIYGANTATTTGGNYAVGVNGTVTGTGTAGTSIGVYGEGTAGSGATTYGGYFTLGVGNTATTGAVLTSQGVQPASVSSGNGRSAISTFTVVGGTGGNTTTASGTTTAGTGAGVTINTGNGGTASGAATTSNGGAAGSFSIIAGNGGDATAGTTRNGGNGGNITLTAGNAGGGASAGGAAGTITLQGGNGASLASTPNTAGGSVTIKGGNAGTAGTGNANGGDLILQGGVKVNSGTEGAVIVRPQNNSTASFLLQTASAADTMFTADTTNNRLIVGNATGTGSATTLLVLDTGVSGTPPTGVKGAMYYDSTNDKFKCFQGAGAGQWVDCISTGGGGTGTLKFMPEFAGGVPTADGGDNSGTLTSDFQNGLSGTEGEKHNYYQWSTAQTSAQDYSIVVNVQIPSDCAATCTLSNFGFWHRDPDAATATAKTTWSLNDVDETSCFSADFNGGTANQWEQETTTSSGCTFNANDIITFTFKVHTSSSAGIIRLGEFEFQYTR